MNFVFPFTFFQIICTGKTARSEWENVSCVNTKDNKSLFLPAELFHFSWAFI